MAPPPPSFDAVYRDCHRHVYALCRQVLGDATDAQDALQETFLQVLQALPGFRSESNVKTWVHRIALRTAIKLRGRRPVAASLDHETLGTTGDPAARHAEDDAVS